MDVKPVGFRKFADKRKKIFQFKLLESTPDDLTDEIARASLGSSCCILNFWAEIRGDSDSILVNANACHDEQLFSLCRNMIPVWKGLLFKQSFYAQV